MRPYFVTNRLAEGLPFVPNVYLRRILFGVLARAQERHPSIAICAWLFMLNHYHAIVIPMGDPKELASFMREVNGEIAKALCRLLGKRNCKIWAQRYNAVALLCPHSIIEKMAYTFANPVAADLVESAAEWEGVSTFSTALEDSATSHKWIASSKLFKLRDGPFTKQSLVALSKTIDEAPCRARPLIVRPLAWKSFFEETKGMADEEVAKVVISRVHDLERAHAARRTKQKQSVVGSERLALQNPHQKYRPQKFGRRVFCMSSCPDLRKVFIQAYREFCETCRAVWKAWSSGDFSISYPPGAFLPPFPPRANLIPT